MNTAYPTLNFGLGEDIDRLRDAVHQMCQKEIAPRAAAIDRDNEFPAELWRTFGDMGLLVHTGLYSVQLQPPGTTAPALPSGSEPPALPAAS